LKITRNYLTTTGAAMSIFNITSLTSVGSLSTDSMPTSIYKFESFNQLEPEVARRILKSGLANFDKKMLCLYALMPFPKVSLVDVRSDGFHPLSVALSVSEIASRFKGEYTGSETIVFSTIDPNNEFVLTQEDLEQARAKLDEANQIGIDSVEEFKVKSEKYGWEIIPAANISKDDFNSASEEEQINMLNRIDGQKELTKKLHETKDALTKELVQFWRNKVEYLSKTLDAPT
jgi:hypothetical protein